MVNTCQVQGPGLHIFILMDNKQKPLSHMTGEGKIEPGLSVHGRFHLLSARCGERQPERATWLGSVVSFQWSVFSGQFSVRLELITDDWLLLTGPYSCGTAPDS